MTCGIYKLAFKNTNKVYIGQSRNIELRYKKHLYKLANGTHTPKLNLAYTEYGTPTFEILAECHIEELNQFENETIDIYNAVSEGFNTASIAGVIGPCPGELNSNSKYTNKQILEVFNYIVDSPNITLKEISEISEVSYNVVAQISKGTSHKWLQSSYPVRYNIMITQRKNRHSIANSASSHNIVYPKIISPKGVVYTVLINKAFAIEHGVDPANLHKLLTYKAKSHKGWKLYKENLP